MWTATSTNRSHPSNDNEGSSSSTHNKQLLRMSQEDYNAITRLPGNNACIECRSSKGVEWALTSYGVLFCNSCSERLHALMGVQLRSIQVKSTWNQPRLNQMKLGGNEKFRAYMALQDVEFSTLSFPEMFGCDEARDYCRDLRFAAAQTKSKRGAVDSDVLVKAYMYIPEEEDPKPSILSTLTSIVSSPKKENKRVRTITEETMPMEDASESFSSFMDDASDSGRSFATRLKPIPSLSATATNCVKRCLEAGLKDQSLLYRLTTFKMATPTVTYLGREYRAAVDRQGPSFHPEDIASKVVQMGLHHFRRNSNPTEQEAHRDYLKKLSNTDFRRLKETLRNKGALTSMCVEEMLYSVAKTARFEATKPTPAQERTDNKNNNPVEQKTRNRRRPTTTTPPTDGPAGDRHRRRKTLVSPCA